jgi:ParB family chromosome partitioning protein
MQKKGLGRGLSALIPAVAEPKTESSQGSSPKQVAVDRITTSPFQPRRSFDEAKIDEMASSIRNQGII